MSTPSAYTDGYRRGAAAGLPGSTDPAYQRGYAKGLNDNLDLLAEAQAKYDADRSELGTLLGVSVTRVVNCRDYGWSLESGGDAPEHLREALGTVWLTYGTGAAQTTLLTRGKVAEIGPLTFVCRQLGEDTVVYLLTTARRLQDVP